MAVTGEDESKGAVPASAATIADTVSVVRAYRDRIRANLHGSVLPFWTSHSFDAEHGGFFNCLDEDGSVYDTTKHVWLQGRQVWMFCRVYNAYTDDAAFVAAGGEAGGREKLLEQASAGLKFLREHATASDGQVYFALAADGKPRAVQRKIFSACFYALALSEYARAVGDERVAAEAVAEAGAVIDKLLAWKDDPTALGRPVLDGARPLEPLAIPMMVLHVIQEYLRDRPSISATGKYDAEIENAVKTIRLHIHEDKKVVLENVDSSGSFVDCIEGRQLNPGHAIESGWFMLEHALATGDTSLRDLSLQVIDWSYERGWDAKHGGIWYFLDSSGRSPVQLEWNMKLWWPHCEAMIAYAYAYSVTSDERYLRRFVEVTDYTWSHFVDKKYGEWYGYLDEAGRVTHRFKGGPYKGCFHVPRALFMCDQLLSGVLAAASGTNGADKAATKGPADS